MAPGCGIRYRILKKIQEPPQAWRTLPGGRIQYGYLVGRGNIVMKQNPEAPSADGFVGDEVADHGNTATCRSDFHEGFRTVDVHLAGNFMMGQVRVLAVLEDPRAITSMPKSGISQARMVSEVIGGLGNALAFQVFGGCARHEYAVAEPRTRVRAGKQPCWLPRR